MIMFSVTSPLSSGIAAGAQYFARMGASTTSRCAPTKRPCAVGTSTGSSSIRSNQMWPSRPTVVLAPYQLILNTRRFALLDFSTVSVLGYVLWFNSYSLRPILFKVIFMSTMSGKPSRWWLGSWTRMNSTETKSPQLNGSKIRNRRRKNI